MASWLGKTDPSSYSNPEEFRTSHIHLCLKVDFDKKILTGYAEVSIEKCGGESNVVVFDAKDLVIRSVIDKNTTKNLVFKVDDPISNFGSKLSVTLPDKNVEKCVIRFDYETSPKASALQWLEPSKTDGKKHPYMFAVCQAIHARSMFPCQDTAANKFTYTASISASSELVALMSAVRDGEEDAGDGLKTFKFVQKVPVPSYLVVVAVGALESREISPRVHVWSEKEIVDKCAYEFAEAETMLKTAEDLMGPYVWGVYDILTLPASFPYGGMENPCLTFVTPSLLAGDRSLANVVAHEISHSWTGNLVTNVTYEHFWLNEGFTVFMERKIIGRLLGEPARHFSAILGWNELDYGVNIQLCERKEMSKLVIDLTGIDPDDTYSAVPYEKGHTFLFYLEQLLGGPEKFEPFLRSYIEKYKMQSIDTNTWKSYLYEYFSDQKEVLDKVDWNAWLYGTGMPPVKPDYDRSLEVKCRDLCKMWMSAETEKCDKFTAEDLKDFTSPQITSFLHLLQKEAPLPEGKLEILTKTYGFDKTQNFEILFSWIRLGLLSHWEPIVPHAVKLISEQGRMKFVKPIYRDLYNWEKYRELAISTFKKNKDGMMSCVVLCVESILKLDCDQK